jgi:GNAT superfamily N-acetyltransferase
MLDQWFRPLHLPMTAEQFRLLPRHPAYKYEYAEGQAWLSPRPRTFNALLDLTPTLAFDTVAAHGSPVVIRPMGDRDWACFPKLFAASFENVPPFSALESVDRLKAAHECLHQAKSGGDGPVLEPACFVAESPETRKPVGGILITLIPRRDEGEWWDGYWDSAPATESARRLLGRPHLTWVFVLPTLAQRGIGSALLAHSVNALLAMEYADLASTFMIGNDSTMLWHWRNGFRLLAYPGSMRGK